MLAVGSLCLNYEPKIPNLHPRNLVELAARLHYLTTIIATPSYYMGCQYTSYRHWFVEFVRQNQIIKGQERRLRVAVEVYDCTISSILFLL